LLFAASTLAQPAPRQPLINQPVMESQLTTLRGNTHPMARPQFDIGAAAPDLPMQRMLLVLKRSPQQDAALQKLLDDQQDKASPNYHKWLTPDEFGVQFGATDQDLQQISGWLQSHGLQVNRITHGRTVIEFSGVEAQVENAMHTSIHKFLVNGEEHWANTSDPQIPAALAPAVAGIVSLHSFYKKPQYHFTGVYAKSPVTGNVNLVSPEFTFPDQQSCGGNCFAVAPFDFATIYNLLPLWNSGIDGTGQSIAIVGRSNINIQDVRDFRSIFGLAVNDPTITLDGFDPGLTGDEIEAAIDVQWSGAAAPQAAINLVVSGSTETSDGVDLSALYIVDRNLAPVMSESFGQCEAALGSAGNQFYRALWEQAASQGISVFVSSGDNGSAGCDFNQGFVPQPAQFGLEVSGLASTPFNVAVGGTDFNDFSNPQTYWNISNDPTTQESAKGYIPETTWNDSCSNAIFASIGFSTNGETNCNNSQLRGFVSTIGGSGGASSCITGNGTLASCAGGYPKPSWQTGSGVPADGKRDIPDVSLFASNGFVGNFYVLCEADLSFAGTCNLNQPFVTFFGVGGTSVSSPAFAGIMSLVDQQMHGRQGNPNFVFYKLAAQQTPSSCNSSTGPASTCVFNDVTSGTIAMPCQAGSRNCTVSTPGHQFGILSGYTATTGYDLATGLGSVNANNLVTKWSTVTSTFRPTLTSLTLTPTTNLIHGQSVTVTGNVAPSSGTGTPTGDVSLLTSTGLSVDGFTLSGGTISGSTTLLPGGTYTVTAHYPGDGTFGSSNSTPPISVTVGKENSSSQLQLITFDFQGNLISNNATTAVYGAPVFLRANVLNSAGALCQPNPLGGSGCPTGNVNLTDNNSPLDGGTFGLNSLGYAEDQVIQLSGGSHSVKVQYPGDGSFNASTTTTAYSITPAPTTIGAPFVQFGQVSSPFSANVTVQSTSSGVAPTGTVTFRVNGSAVGGTVSYSSSPGSFSNPTASLFASFNSSASAFATAGTYTISASYSGDTNYGTSTSSGSSISVKYPPPGISMNPTSVTVAAGASVTISAIVDTFRKNVPLPTGTVPFIFWGPMSPVTGTQSYSAITDSSGNVALQASLTFVPAGSSSIAASYNGDSNYPAAQSGSGLVDVIVTGADFALVPSSSSLTVNPGSGGNLLIYVQAQSSYNGTINFSSGSCTGLPSESTCSFNPASVTGAGYASLNVSTTAPHFLAASQAGSFGNGFLLAAAGMPVASLLFVVIPHRRTRRTIGCCMLGTILALGLGCGGGSGGGGGGGGGSTDPGTPRGNYQITVTATSGSGSSAITHTTTFTLVVQ